jgi:hypothetical protein
MKRGCPVSDAVGGAVWRAAYHAVDYEVVNAVYGAVDDEVVDTVYGAAVGGAVQPAEEVADE